MGREVMKAIISAPDLSLVGGCDAKATDTSVSMNGIYIPMATDLARLISNTTPDIIVDFSLAAAVPQTAEIAARAGVSLVIGTTGVSPQVLSRLDAVTKEYGIGIIVAPNFALGAVVMMQLSRIAARYFDWSEIIEFHHEKKADAPSGTAIATARDMQSAREKPFESLPGDVEHRSRGEIFYGVPIHSVRLPGLVAHQEVIFGALGQTLTIRHDTTSRESFMPGVLLAIREMIKRKGEFVFGLDKLLGF